MSIVKLSNNGVKNATAIGSITGLGSMVFIKKLTASDSSTLSFLNGSSDVVFDSTYKEYANDSSTYFSFQADTGTNTSYNQTITSTHFRAAHQESDANANLAEATDQDQAQATGFQNLAYAVGGNADESIAGFLHIFDPSNSTFAKHFMARCNVFNTTTALTRVQFKMSGGNIEAGDICLYGIV